MSFEPFWAVLWEYAIRVWIHGTVYGREPSLYFSNNNMVLFFNSLNFERTLTYDMSFQRQKIVLYNGEIGLRMGHTTAALQVQTWLVKFDKCVKNAFRGLYITPNYVPYMDRKVWAHKFQICFRFCNPSNGLGIRADFVNPTWPPPTSENFGQLSPHIGRHREGRWGWHYCTSTSSSSPTRWCECLHTTFFYSPWFCD